MSTVLLSKMVDAEAIEKQGYKDTLVEYLGRTKVDDTEVSLNTLYNFMRDVNIHLDNFKKHFEGMPHYSDTWYIMYAMVQSLGWLEGENDKILEFAKEMVEDYEHQVLDYEHKAHEALLKKAPDGSTTRPISDKLHELGELYRIKALLEEMKVWNESSDSPFKTYMSAVQLFLSIYTHDKLNTVVDIERLPQIYFKYFGEV